jgi:hypothetical protein
MRNGDYPSQYLNTTSLRREGLSAPPAPSIRRALSTPKAWANRDRAHWTGAAQGEPGSHGLASGTGRPLPYSW